MTLPGTAQADFLLQVAFLVGNEVREQPARPVVVL